MIRQLLLPSSNNPRPNNVSVQGLLQGPQGLLQTLLDLGETFLSSELSEVDLQDLEAKLSAARCRDHDAIRDLQKKIEELSGMSAMVNRLKNELKEEKEKAKEEAEDLTQEMAELRYQLMQRVDEERELRARTEEASLRRIAELEAQLKYARQETSLLLGRKQSAEAQAQAHALELQHLKSALDEAKQTQNNLLQEKEEMERKSCNQQQALQLKVTTLQTELAEMNTQLSAADGKIGQLESTCTGLRKQNEAILLSLEQKKVEMQLKVLEERKARSELACCVLEGETVEDLGTLEQQKSYLLHEVNEMLELIATFKLQLYVLASEYYEVKGSCDVACMTYVQESNERDEPSLGENDTGQGLLTIRDVACMTDVEESAVQDVEESTAQNVPSHGESDTDHELHDVVCMTDAEESNAWDVPSSGLNDTDHGFHMSPEVEGMTDVKESYMWEVPSSVESDTDHGALLLNASKPDIRYERPWTVQIVVDIVDIVTEEMTKLLRILLKCSQSRKPDLLSSLESRLQLWSNIPQKALPEKIIGSGVLSEWGDLVVDLLAQSRRELHFMQQTVGDREAEMESWGNIRAEFAVLSKEALFAKEELVRTGMQFQSELGLKDDVIRMLEGKLEQISLALLQAQERVAQQDLSNSSLYSDLHKLEVEMKSSKAVWASEKKRLEDSLQEQHEAMQKDRARANKDIDKLERIVEELRCRLAENEQELEELVHANDLNIDAVVAAKLRQLDQKLKNSQMAEADLQAERAELASQVVWLQAKLEEAERELEAENEQHVEALIQYEEERGLLEAELEAGKQALHFRNATSVQTAKGKGSAYKGGKGPWVEGMDLFVEKGSLSEGEQKQMEKFVGVLKHSILEKDRMLAAQKEDLLFQKELNRKLMNESAHLNSELLAVQHELSLCESQATDMGSTISNLQEALMVERMKADQAQADIDLHTKRQDKDYHHLKLRLDELLSNIKMMQADLSESRKRESEASAQVKKLGLELLLAKEEAVKSEVRLQKALKQIEGQLDAEKGKLEAAVLAQKQAELLLLQQVEELKSLEEEKIELQRLLVHAKGACRQLERERDDFRVAYVELENQFSRRRGAFAR